MLQPLLSVRNVSKAFARNPVLRDVSLDIAPGEVLALIGENGAGKSTLVNIVSGTLQPDGGTLSWQGQPVVLRNTQAALERGIVHIRQELSIIRALSVMENLFLGDYLAGRLGWIDKRAMATRARALLDRVGARDVDPRRRAGTLRVAEQQMVEIAKALARNVRLLILDEPTASLTPHEAEALFAVIRDLKAQGVAVVFISHRLEEVFGICDRIAVLRDGSPVADYAVAATDRERVIRDMTGRAFGIAALDRHEADRSAPPLLAVRGLADGARIGPLSFELRAGQILGVFGLVGAGRTELIELVAGARRAVAGEARCLGRDGLPASPAQAWARGIAHLPEGRKTQGIFPSRSALENISLAARQRAPLVVAARGERARGAGLKDDLGIVAATLDLPIRLLSGGNQQKALFARCLAAGPKILLLDEPTHGVDLRTKADIYRIIQKLAREGMAVIFTSSELPEIRALATDIMVLARGRATYLQPNCGEAEDVILAHAFAEDQPDA
ncbi:sugar ABC transporter ATP-binding protein [Labrys monachus]|uniref:ABC-type sugar transport system ATPase subunit n=1 Tax=Labrys monachus TaxID=217067 RepID=A0ABU0F7F7_9HYPH|nr:sugar ABC transporter ATP-binding protein [Labrys monachus]MDQ0390547.1 ABC-type sugar transport system ATPase subunit [Labrys monachus]